MSRTRVKICGITRIEDGLQAVACGADAIGLNFYPSSPRLVDFEQAGAITSALPPFTKVVGLFVNAAEAEVRAALEAVPLDLLQFHGDEAPEDCEIYGRPYIKSLAMKPGVDVPSHAKRFASASGLLLDSWHRQLRGGSGTSFDWSLIPTELGKPIILAGGLDAQNVAEAIRQVGPFAVDVSGGVESAKGIKDREKIAAFMEAVNSV